MPEVKISKVEIAIDKKVISLSLDQAKELQSILNKTFPVPDPLAPYRTLERHDHYYPKPYWIRDWWNDHQPRWGNWEIQYLTSGSTNDSTLQLTSG